MAPSDSHTNADGTVSTDSFFSTPDKSDRTYIALYGVTPEELTKHCDEQQLATITSRVLGLLQQYGVVDPEAGASCAVVAPGDRVEDLSAADEQYVEQG